MDGPWMDTVTVVSMDTLTGGRRGVHPWMDSKCAIHGSDTETSLYVHAVGFSTGWVRD